MKKNFLFGIMAVFLAGFGFGGITNATSIECYTDSTMSTSVKARIGQGESMKCYSKVADAYEELEEGGTINLIKTISKDEATLNITENSAKKFYLNFGELKPSTTQLKYIKTDNPYLINNEVDPSNKQLYEFNIEDAYFHIERTYYNEKNDPNHDIPLILNVYYSTSLRQAIANAQAKQYGAKIILLRDFEDKSTASPNVTKNVIFDLNGKTLNLTTKPILISEGGTLTIENGTIISSNTVADDGNNNYSIALNGGGTLIIGENVTIISHNDKAIVNNGGTVTLNGGKITADTNGIVLGKNATLNITSGEIKATENFAIAGNGTEGEGGYGITITDGTITSTNGPAIYHPNNGTLTINGGTIQGSDALYIKAGTTNITDGTLIGNGEKADYEFNGNGVNPTGDGIVVENADYPGGNPTVTINGGTISSTNNKAIGYYKKGDTLLDPIVTAISNKMTLTDGWLWVKDGENYKPQQGIIVTFTDGEDEIEKQTIANGGNVSEPEDPTKEGNIFVGWFNGEKVFDFETPITADTTLTAHWATALTASTSSIKAASIPSDEGREKRNLDKFTVSNSYDAESKTLTVTITDNGMKAYVGGNSETAKKWLGLIADFGAIVNGSNTVVEGIEKYTIGSNNEAENNIDRTDANIYGGDEKSETDFIIWITREDKDGKTIRFVNAAAEDDYVNVKFVFKDKQTTPSYSGGGGSSRSSSKTTTTDDTKKVEDTSKTDETKSDETKTDESKADETKTSEEAKAAADAQALKDGYSQEFIDAYNFARKNNITTKDTIREADMDAPLTRIAMAKMLSQYAINVLGKTPDTSIVVPTFPDVDAKLDADYNNGVTLAYQLGIMGINVNKYRPFDLVTRAEFGTALSRMLYGLSDGEGDQWYKTHLDKLMEEQIITNNNPNLQELRGYVMIMLMRSAQ